MTKHLTRWATASVLFTLAACGNPGTPESTEDGAEVIEIPAALEYKEATISIADTLGTFESDVASLSIWQHPSVSFLSAVYAANGEAGLFAVPIDMTASSQTDGVFTGGTAVTYNDAGSILAAFDRGQGVIRFFDVNEVDRSLTDKTSIAFPASAPTMCFAGTDLTLIDANGGIHLAELSIDGENWSVTVNPVSAATTAVDCASTADTTYLLMTTGNIETLNASGLSAESPVSNIFEKATNLAVWPTAQGPIFAILQEDGRLIVGDTKLTLSGFAGEGTDIKIKDIVSGAGNFGGVYRDGLLAALTTTNDLVLIPWLGISSAAQVEPDTISLRPALSDRKPEDTLPALRPIELPPVETHVVPN